MGADGRLREDMLPGTTCAWRGAFENAPGPWFVGRLSPWSGLFDVDLGFVGWRGKIGTMGRAVSLVVRRNLANKWSREKKRRI